MSPVIFENAYCIPRANLFNRSCSHNSRKSVMRWKKDGYYEKFIFFFHGEIECDFTSGDPNFAL